MQAMLNSSMQVRVLAIGRPHNSDYAIRENGETTIRQCSKSEYVSNSEIRQFKQIFNSGNAKLKQFYNAGIYVNLAIRQLQQLCDSAMCNFINPNSKIS